MNDEGSAAGSPSRQRNEAHHFNKPTPVPLGDRAGPSPQMVVGQRKKVHVKEVARATISKVPFTGKYFSLFSLNQPPKMVDQRGLWAP